MSTIFSKEEVNTGRQREFDYLKGIFMLFIYLIHAFQATASLGDSITGWIYTFATMSGAAIFIFVMGLGTVYSRNATPTGFVKSGIRMVIYQYLNNFAYIAALLIPYPFVSGDLAETATENLRFLVKIYIQYTNIFFITGIIYFVLALLIKLNVKAVGYAITGAVISIAAPFLCGIPVNIPVIGYLVKLLIGEADFVSFTPLYFLSYALLGVAFGKLLRHVKDKMGFYKMFIIPGIAVVIAWWGLAFGKYGSDITEMQAFFSYAYTHPNFWHVVASLAHIFVFSAIIFFISARNEPSGCLQTFGDCREGQKSHSFTAGSLADEFSKKDGNAGEPKNPVAKQLLYYSRHISKYYALHIIVYFAAYGFHGYEGFKSYQCWLLALLSIVVTELMVRGFNYLSERMKNKAKPHGGVGIK